MDDLFPHLVGLSTPYAWLYQLAASEKSAHYPWGLFAVVQYCVRTFAVCNNGPRLLVISAQRKDFTQIVYTYTQMYRVQYVQDKLPRHVSRLSGREKSTQNGAQQQTAESARTVSKIRNYLVLAFYGAGRATNFLNGKECYNAFFGRGSSHDESHL